VIKGPEPKLSVDKAQFISAVKEALYAGMIMAYAQGFGLMQMASQEYQYQLDMRNIAKVWRAGCIIRADILDDMMRAFERDRELDNLLLDDYFRDEVVPRQGAIRYVIGKAIQAGIPVYGFSATLAYFDALRSERLPANLIQAQRDYFGAHTYRRLDQEGIFHTEWTA
jgi:6-phosphogluconate dehydrogenase